MVTCVFLLNTGALANTSDPEVCESGDRIENQENGNGAMNAGFMPNTPGAGEWKEYYSRRYGFKARFPEIPARDQEQLTRIKKNLVLQTYQTFQTYTKPAPHAEGYLIAVGSLGREKVKTAALSKALVEIKRQYGALAQLLLQKKGTYQGFPAREFILQYQSRKQVLTLDGVVFLDTKTNRFFQVACLYGPANKKLLADCEYFFQSFKVTPPSQRRSRP